MLRLLWSFVRLVVFNLSVPLIIHGVMLTPTRLAIS